MESDRSTVPYVTFRWEGTALSTNRIVNALVFCVTAIGITCSLQTSIISTDYRKVWFRFQVREKHFESFEGEPL